MERKIDTLPRHVAIILDGNGRWAKSKRMPRFYGHSAGVKNLTKISNYANSVGIKYLTVYAFSVENWSRPKKEVDYLMNLLEKNFSKIIKDGTDLRVRIIGEKDKLSEKLLKEIEAVEKKTEFNTGMTLNIAFNYGGKDEIVHACKCIIDAKEEINKENISKYLYTAQAGDVDLLIRTSGEERLSNFLLWQNAYSEMYFTKTYWPAFSKKDFDKAIVEYNKRERRFGKLKNE